MLFPLLRNMVTLNDRNYRLIVHVFKGHFAHDPLLHIFNKSGKKNPTTIKHIYNESMNLIDSCDVAFNTNDWWNFP